MTRKKKTWIAAALSFTVIGLAAWLLWPNEQAVTSEMYESVRIGMTLEEVRQLLESPGGSRQDFVLWAHDNRKISYGRGQLGKDLLNEHRDEPGIDKYWYGGKGVIVVRFNHDGVSTDKQFFHIGESGASLRQKLRQLVGL